MRVGINGMGRIGRLALRAALGAAERGEDDPRRGNRLDVVHVNEIKGGAAATAHLLEFELRAGALARQHQLRRRRHHRSVNGSSAFPPSPPLRTFHGATLASTWSSNAPASS